MITLDDYILHSTEVPLEFMIMNSYMISLSWIHQHKFRNEFIHMNSDIWFDDIFHDHEIKSKFILWIYIGFPDHEIICYISWPMNSYVNSCIWRILWNHTWNHVYQGSRWGHYLCMSTGLVRIMNPASRGVALWLELDQLVLSFCWSLEVASPSWVTI